MCEAHNIIFFFTYFPHLQSYGADELFVKSGVGQQLLMRQRSKHASESGGDIQRQVSLQQQTSVVQRQTSQVGPPYHALIMCTIVLGVANNPIVPSLLSHSLLSHPPSHHTFPSVTPSLTSHLPFHHTLPPSPSQLPSCHTLPVKPSPSHPPSITPSLT